MCARRAWLQFRFRRTVSTRFPHDIHHSPCLLLQPLSSFANHLFLNLAFLGFGLADEQRRPMGTLEGRFPGLAWMEFEISFAAYSFCFFFHFFAFSVVPSPFSHHYTNNASTNPRARACILASPPTRGAREAATHTRPLVALWLGVRRMRRHRCYLYEKAADTKKKRKK